VLAGFAWLGLSLLTLPGATGADQEADQAATPPAAEYAGMGPQLCLGCHGQGSARPAYGILEHAMALSADADAPFGNNNQACETCHGPSKSHAFSGGREKPDFLFNESTTAEEKNDLCIGCHSSESRFHWPGATHNIQGLACVDCHKVHTPGDPVASLETQPQVCFECHKVQRAQFLRQSRHPVQAASNAFSHIGLMSCTDCHNPHGSDGPAQLKRKSVNDTCDDCHAEKRGPFLWEHQPVSEDCSNCHNPHGSNYPNLLTGRTPWLCQQCHSAVNHSSTALNGVDVGPYSFDRRVVGKDCMNCHGQVHGSNHPSGVALTR
jgi:DmsE family decaheme c-type cytochrome